MDELWVRGPRGDLVAPVEAARAWIAECRRVMAEARAARHAEQADDESAAA